MMSDASQALSRLTIPTAQVFRFFDSLFEFEKLSIHCDDIGAVKRKPKEALGTRKSVETPTWSQALIHGQFSVLIISDQFWSFSSGNFDTDGPSHVCVQFFVCKTTIQRSQTAVFDIYQMDLVLWLLLAARCYQPAPPRSSCLRSAIS